MTTNSTDNTSFEASLEELKTIVETMEQGNLPLDESLKQFERGIHLARTSQQKLQQAEQRVQILMTEHNQQNLAPFNADGEPM